LPDNNLIEKFFEKLDLGAKRGQLNRLLKGYIINILILSGKCLEITKIKLNYL